MKQNQDNLNNTSQTRKTETDNQLKVWETPSLKILPVPSRTQGGPFNKANADNIYYKKS